MHGTKMEIHPLSGAMGADIPGAGLAAGIDDETFGRCRAGAPRRPSGGILASDTVPVLHAHGKEKDRRAHGYIGSRR